MAADNVARTRDIFERVWKQRDYDAFDRTSAPDSIFHDPLGGDLDRDEMKQLMKRFDTAFRLTDATIDDVIDAGNQVVFRFTARARMVGNFGNLRATNKEGSASGIGIFRFEDGKLAEQWSSWNVLDLMQQVGAIPSFTPAGEAPRAGEEARP